ncbi:hypothetical protein A2628_00850 [Candidatus Woesebacteria bacterium RIFCSPHIGHO2_01_FULL_40_22]|uniref:LytR/CpsA/Psr regulator C-terminal domain-containing protein n=1 Tax=Candidatus Woesebacteria bacterium RIFCSPHIGHO2_01_FULL_40_22 TaxID=1802499 RepID=A0A1F7YJ11_9BACT|nr:MAG: hypothetical protein A2628_00850 [Candidatus Woesebacteria bacterium RIFCSPHIGHO2_01_FULL_40_22]
MVTRTNVRHVKKLLKSRNERKRRVSNNKMGKGSSILSRAILLLVFLFVLVLIILVRGKRSLIEGVNKVNIALRTHNDDVEVLSFDFKRGEINEVIIPGDTEVVVARGLGEFRLENVWRVSEDEGLGGELLAETLTSYLKIPVYIWADETAGALAEKHVIALIKAVILPYKTNLTFLDKAKIAYFNLSVKNTKRETINLADYSYLKKQVLIDGEEGFVLSGKPPSELYSLYSVEEISEKALRVSLDDESGEGTVSENLAQVIDVLGAKIAVVNTKEEKRGFCEVKGSSDVLISELQKLFNCTRVAEVSDDVFDVNIKIGSDFSKGF